MSLNIKTAQGLQKINTVYVHKQKEENAGKKDVNFYDYDGTLVKSYTKQEFLSLSAMPANPAHEGLTAQGWNWSLSDAKAYVANYGKLNIGQSYITNDGKTRLYISLHEGRLSPQLGLGINGSVDVDWGDGSEHETMTGSDVNTAVYKEHKYAREGNYIIALTVTGNVSIIEPVSYSSYSCLLNKVGGDHNTGRTYLNSLIKIEIGDNVSIARYAFANCFSLTSITIPNAITSIGSSAFYSCYSLTSITIPDGVTSIGNYTFSGCNSLASITLPNTVTTIAGYAFDNCSSLTSITIPSTVTRIVGGSAFHNCYSLTLITIPRAITSIDEYTFANCNSLTSITIPSTVTSVGSSTFQNCYGLGIIDILPISAPTVSNIDVWKGIPTDCLIFIPYTSPTSYLTASSYPSPSTYTYLGYNAFANGEELPTISSDENYSYTWYATLDDAKAQTNPISAGIGNKIYCRFAVV